MFVRNRVLSIYSFFTWGPWRWHVHDLLCNLHRHKRQACPRAPSGLADMQPAQIKAPFPLNMCWRWSLATAFPQPLVTFDWKHLGAQSGALLRAHMEAPVSLCSFFFIFIFSSFQCTIYYAVFWWLLWKWLHCLILFNSWEKAQNQNYALEGVGVKLLVKIAGAVQVLSFPPLSLRSSFKVIGAFL